MKKNRLKKQTENVESFYFPNKSVRCSKVFFLFLSDYRKFVELFYFTVTLAHHVDRAALAASKALIIGAKEEEIQIYQETIDNPNKASKKLLDYSSVNSKNLTLNILDGFLWYISAIIQEAIRRKPEILKSQEMIDVETIFAFRNSKELINYLVDRKINSLSYGGISDIEKYMINSLGIEIFSDEESRKKIKKYIEIRNIFVHNRGIVNRIFLRKVKNNYDHDFALGREVHLKYDELVDISKFCILTSIKIDNEICKKFKVQSKKISTWEKESSDKIKKI